jgi:hypothetical protein
MTAIGEDIELAIGSKQPGTIYGSYFWKMVREEERTDYEIKRLKDYLKEAKK